MPRILVALYLISMVAAGWHLFTMGRGRGAKIGAAVALVVPVPLLFLIPAFMKPERPFADLLCAIGVALMAGGAAALSAGAAVAWAKARRT